MIYSTAQKNSKKVLLIPQKCANILGHKTRILLSYKEYTMPNIKSAKKRVAVTETKKLQNQMVRSQMNTAIKKFNAAISENNVELAKELLPVASSKIDNAATKKVIHKNAANRKKAQIAKTLSQLEKGVIVIKVDAKTLKQAEQKAAAQKKAEEAAAIKAQRNETKKAKEQAKQPVEKKPAKKTAAKKTAKKDAE